MTDIVFSIDSILAAVATAAALPDELGGIALFTVPGVGVVVDIKLMVIYIGGILGIIAMRFVAGYFLILLDRFHGLASGAYYLVGWIGLKLIGGGLHDAVHPDPRVYVPGPGNWREGLPAWAGSIPLEMNRWIFWVGMALIVTASLAYKPRKARKPPEGEYLGRSAAAGLIRADQGKISLRIAARRTPACRTRRSAAAMLASW